MNSQVETEKLVKSRILITFVREHNQVWNHQDWLDLLSEVRKKGYNTLSDDEIGVLLENEKAKQLNSSIKTGKTSKKS